MNNIAFKSYKNLTTHKSHCKYYFKNPHFIDEDLEIQKISRLVKITQLAKSQSFAS